MRIFFSLPNEYPAAGVFSRGHVLLLLITAALVTVALWLSREMSASAVRRTVRALTACLWVLELCKILFVLLVVRSLNPNEFIPLYYCSLILYAGVLSSLPRGRLRHTGDCFIVMGGVIGGAVFLLLPTTSLPKYPACHFISWHSFFLHGAMVYLGLLLLLRGCYRPELRDVRFAAALISIMCAAALLFNTVYNRISAEPVANLMFISRDFAGTPISILYHLCGPFFTPVMWLGQAFLPFFVTYGGIWLVNKICMHRRKTATKL